MMQEKIETVPERLCCLYLINSVSEDGFLITMTMFVGFKKLHLIQFMVSRGIL